MGTGPALGKHSSHGLCTASPAPTGTVDLLTITLKLVMWVAMAPATSNT